MDSMKRTPYSIEVMWRSLACLWLFISSAAASPWLLAQSIKILYTNDIESVFDPLPAYWRDDMSAIGGMAKLSSLIQQERQGEFPVFLFDAGDMFTGALSKKTGGTLVFDLYGQMGYDAVNLGNHEFEYGWQQLVRVLPRATYPVLNANIVHEGGAAFGRPYALIEKAGVRVAVIGLMGIDAFLNTMMPANRKGLAIQPLESSAQSWVDLLRPEVDLLVLLTHQGRTAPMQTNKEDDAEVQRGIEEELELAGALRGVDLLIAGHTDHGLVEPVRHPATGTWIVQTYGQGMHLGVLELERDARGTWQVQNAALKPVNADVLPDDPSVAERITAARLQFPELQEVVGSLTAHVVRRYYHESTMGNLVADALKSAAGTEIGMITPGALRSDLAAGPVTKEAVLNVFPFIDRVTRLEVSGRVLRSVIEQGLRRDYGLPNFSGLSLTFVLGPPPDATLLEAFVNGQPLDDDAMYSLATGSFTATGGEGYEQLPAHIKLQLDLSVADAIARYISEHSPLAVPPLGRQRVLSSRRDLPEAP